MQSMSVCGFFIPPDPSICFHIFLGGEYVYLSYGPLKIQNLAKSGRKSVHPFIKNLGVHI